MKRAHPEMCAAYRACNQSDETLGHVLGQCPATKAERIKRHNDVVAVLQANLSRKHRVLIEPMIAVRGERFKPDLVVMKEEKVLVLDVTVRYENGNFLAAAAQEKKNKYEIILPKLKQIFKKKHDRVVPIVVGSRGALPRATVTELRKLKIGKKHWLTISMIALRSSIEMMNSFMDS